MCDNKLLQKEHEGQYFQQMLKIELQASWEVHEKHKDAFQTSIA